MRRPCQGNGSTPEAASISEHDRKLLARYQVTLIAAAQIQPSPENDEVYGQVGTNDPAMPILVRSIQRLGLEEPLILTRDNYILSGHRRYYALRRLGWQRIPVRYANVYRKDNTDYHRLLAEYNPQRIKSVASTLAETLLQTSGECNDGHAWAEYQVKRTTINVETMDVDGEKTVDTIGDRRGEFLEAVKKVVREMRSYWPLSVRQIH
jgi:hypothetical protein